jgi:hypothetical protein
MLAAGAALLWANIDAGSYADVWHAVLTLGVGDAAIALDLQHWVNDGLMTIFFFVVARELERELVLTRLAQGSPAVGRGRRRHDGARRHLSSTDGGGRAPRDPERFGLSSAWRRRLARFRRVGNSSDRRSQGSCWA